VATTRAASNDPARTAVKVDYREKSDDRPALHVLAVGVSDYQDKGIGNLRFAHRDAEDFAAAIKRYAGPLHGRVDEPTVLTNEKATKAGIVKAMDDLVGAARPKSTVVIFLAAHGKLDGRGNYYLMAHDTDHSQLRVTALPWGEIEQTIKDLAGCRLLFFADTCHSAAVELAVDQDLLNERSLAGEDRGAFVFASCRARQHSYEPAALGHGLFTMAMLDTLNQNGIQSDRSPVPPDGKLSLDEFKLVVGERMSALRDQVKLTAPQDLNYMQSRMSIDFPLFELKPAGN
jgi:uncharacterized caspase-like protein